MIISLSSNNFRRKKKTSFVFVVCNLCSLPFVIVKVKSLPIMLNYPAIVFDKSCAFTFISILKCNFILCISLRYFVNKKYIFTTQYSVFTGVFFCFVLFFKRCKKRPMFLSLSLIFF